jgi:DNA modification methylase
MGNGQIALGDCLDVMRSVPSASVDLVVTDPPYRMTKTGNSCRPNYMPNGEILECDVPNTKLWFSEVYRVLNNDSHFYTFVNINEIHSYLNVAEEIGFKLHNILSMIKNTKMPNRWYLKYTENVLFFRKGKSFAINDMKSRDYEFVSTPTIKTGKIHPTEKPINFIQNLIKNSSKENNLILDPFIGSGTTAIAAENTGRRWIGIERDPTYFGLACERIARHVCP